MSKIICADTGEIVFSYREYLQTEHWKKLASFKKNRNRCVFCGDRETLNVHHLTYKNLGNEKKKDLIVLCGNCHTYIHKIIGKKWSRLKALTKKTLKVSNKLINREYDDKTPSMKTGTTNGRKFSLYITKDKIPQTLRLSICAIIDRGLQKGIIESDIIEYFVKRKTKDKPMFDLYIEYKNESDVFILKQYNNLKSRRSI